MRKIENGQLQLTTEQELSLRTDRNLSVMANAGSGKTFVLVERFRRIIDETTDINNDIRIDTSQLLAITFTKKAAAEMKKKIINAYDRELRDLEAENNPKLSKLSNLKRIREGLTYANISTIHSFCSSLLRQFPLEAGIPINFSEMSEAEKLKLMEQSIDSTMDSRLNSNNDSEQQDMEFLLSKFNRKQLHELMQTIIYKIDLFEDFDNFFKMSDEEIKQKIIGEFGRIFNLDTMITRIQELTETFNNDDFLLSKKKNTKIYKNFYKSVNQNQKTILSYNSASDNYAEIYKVFNAFEKIMTVCFTKQNTPNTNIVKMMSREDGMGFLMQYTDLVKNIKKGQPILESLFFIDEYLKTDRILWDFIKEIQGTNDDAKLYLNELDFDDLQLRVKELLKNKDVVDKIRSQIDYIMIDEFQDTNKLQYEIIKSLVPEITEMTINEDDINLFIVGDPKQSIYGFRNADISVFYTAVDDIENYNSMLIEQDKLDTKMPEEPERTIESEEIKGKNRLTSTFRLRPAVAAFINTIGSKIMNPEESSYEVDYTPLVCSKDTDNIKLDRNNIITSENNLGDVVFLLSTRKKDEEEPAGNIQEEKLIAQYIRKVKNENKNYTFNDFAILSRTKSSFSKLGKMLSDEDIPFKIHSGNAFYETAEIKDFLSFLNFIYNPDNDLALLSILRAPFFNISNTKILELKSFGKQKTIWQNLKQYAQNERGDKLSETFLLLNEILSISPSMSIPQVILLIIEKTGWNGLIENELDHYQKTANIDKLIDLARSFENTGFKNIYDFVEELKFITDNEIMESEAAVLTDENAVNIMSIHAAKGLQFPVVIIYNTNKKTGGKTRFTVSTQFGPGFPLKLNDKDVVIKNVDSAINLLNKLIKQQKETAEDKRVLYVAMTRAEDILALSVNAIEGKNNIYAPLGQMKLILEGLNIESMDELFDKDIKISLLTELEIRKNKKILTCNLEMNIGKIFEDEISLTENEESKKVILSAMILTDNITTNQTYMTFSPSKFLNFDYNKENFFDKYILGLPEELIDKKDIVNETNENTPGGVFGTAIHYALQYIDKWMKDDFSIYNDALKDTVTSSLESYQYNNINETTDEIIAECKSISETELIRKEYKNILNSKAEYFLEIPLDNNILHGIIDLLLKKEDGTFEIWDWKSNQINTEEDQIKTAWHYELQMRIYCYFISKLHPGQNKYNARLLFTRLAGKFKTSEDWTHKFVWTKEELDKTPEIINERIAKMKNEPLGIAD